MSDFNGMSVAEMKAALEEKAAKLELQAQFLELQQKKADLNARAVSGANLAKILSCRIDPPTSLVYGGWHGKGRKKETKPRNTRVRALNR